MKKKIIVDILMFILMLLEFSRGYISTMLHEIFGICLFILVIFHLILNNNYLKNIFKGKYNLSRIIMLITNLGFFITFVLSCIFGILSSEDLLKVLNVGNLKITYLHKMTAYISLIFMALHLGINFNVMFGKLKNKMNKYGIYILELIMIIYGAYSFIKLDIIKHITGTYGFSIYDGNIFINILNYLCTIFMIAFMMYKINELIKKKEGRK